MPHLKTPRLIMGTKIAVASERTSISTITNNQFLLYKQHDYESPLKCYQFILHNNPFRSHHNRCRHHNQHVRKFRKFRNFHNFHSHHCW